MKTTFENGILTAYLEGEIDHDAAVVMRRQLDASVQTVKPRILCLDFAGVGFMDSSGVGLVMGRYRMMKLLGGSLYVVRVPERIYRIFAMSGLEGLGVMR